ncbi:hypothetical protein M0812_01109 [Anaeramoeba flamelloides]|uniref:Uncharacterized protein n=1 Tax=Anaeramoeba flamelloides TaxID=1746091 RepID=A0AAV8A735_9EUKA|nr:hypothetical protein M0812_01109 [Anaeramoeba flamelloides]
MENHNNSQSIPEETEDHHLFDLEPHVMARLRISICKQGKNFINIFIENSKCHENKIINIYLNNGKEMNNSNTRVGVQGRQNRYDNLRTMMNNNQNNLNLRKKLNPNNPESMFYSDEETKTEKCKKLLRKLLLKTLTISQSNIQLSSEINNLINIYVEIIFTKAQKSDLWEVNQYLQSVSLLRHKLSTKFKAQKKSQIKAQNSNTSKNKL